MSFPVTSANGYVSSQVYSSDDQPKPLYGAPSAPPVPSDNETIYVQAYPVSGETRFGEYPTLPPQIYPTTVMHAATLRLLEKASETASIILKEPKTTHSPSSSESTTSRAWSSVPAMNIDLSDRSVNLFSRRETVHVHHHGDSRAEEKKKDNTNRWLLGVAGFVATVVTAYFIGKKVAQGEEATEKNEDFVGLKALWESNKYFYPDGYLADVDKVIHKTDSMNKNQQTNRIQNLALLALGFVAGATALTGAVVGSKAFMVAGIALGMTTVVATLFKIGYTTFSKKDENAAKDVKTTVGKILNRQITTAD